ncbi:MAG: DUF2059 domain-containing protein [Nitrospiraceae bacterium]|nr:DUF2059 domain-containing protein [Nitrospiraceae bacterium]
MSTYRLIILASFITFFSFTSLSYAITESKERDIQKLLKIMGTSSIVQEMSDVLVATVITQEKQSYPNMPKKIEHAISNIIHQVVLEHASELDRMIVPLYDKYYTHEEIKELIKFFNSQIGKKYSSVLKPMMQDMFPIAQEWGKKIGAIAAQRVEQELKRYGYK